MSHESIIALLKPALLAEWLATKSGRFDYIDGQNCMLAQYLRHHGVKFGFVSGQHIVLESGAFIDIPEIVNMIALNGDFYGGPKTWTFENAYAYALKAAA